MHVRRAVTLAALALLPSALAGPGRAADEAPAAPCAPVAATGDAADGGSGPPAAKFRAGATLYSHGDPTAEEQLLLELMNRARLDPSAEADRIFADYGDADVTAAVDYFITQRPGVEYTRAENRTAFRSYLAQAPLAFNERLIAAAVLHTHEMVEAGEQSHQLPGEPALASRVTSAGYSYAAIAESVFAYAKSMVHAHAGFAIDWGQAVPVGETRPSLGHRNSLMNHDGTRDYVEAGISVQAKKVGTSIGPRVLTIDFGRPSSSATRFVTGVCYRDDDGDGFYDAGEGLAGLRIDSDASSFYTVTSASGGYALPVPASAGAITVTATGETGGATESFGTQDVVVTMAGKNVKLDFTGPAAPPPADVRTFTSAGPVALTGSGATDESAIVIPAAFDTTSDDVGDLDVAVTFAHPDASRYRIDLVSPTGTTVTLWDRGLALADLSGTFDTSLAPAGDLGAFVGEAYAGSWRLRVTDDATEGARTLTSWSLSVRPQWVRGLHAPRTNLGLTKFAAVNRGGYARGSLKIAGAVDAGGTVLDGTKPFHVRLLNADGTQFQRLSPTSVSASTAVGATSKATFRATLTGLDFAGPLPSPLIVEVSAGGAVARQTIALRRGAFVPTKAPLAPYFRIDTLTSLVPAGKPRATTVTGKLPPAGLVIADTVEVFAGDQHTVIPATAFRRKGTRRTAAVAGVIRSLQIDVRTGKFTLRLSGDHEPLVDGVFPLTLRLGTFLGDTAVRPSGTTTLRY